MPKYEPMGINADRTRLPWMEWINADRTRQQWREWLNGARGAPEWMWPIIGMAASLRMVVDLHSGNVMLSADGTLVMTDPFSALET